MDTISTEQKTLWVFFRNDFFGIPQFQREYRWPPRTIWLLLQDIWNAYEQGKPVKPIGMVITFKNTLAYDGKENEIVDGQQRLVTLLIFFRAMLIWVKRHEIGTEPGWVHTFKSLLSDIDPKVGKPASRLRLNRHEENDWMRRYIFCTDANVTEDGILDEAESHAPTRIANIQRCLQTCLSFLSYRLGVNRGLSLDTKAKCTMYKQRQKSVSLASSGHGFDNHRDLDGFQQFLMFKTSLAHSKCTDSSIAIEQFCCMNATGLPLTQSQMLKAHMMNQKNDPCVFDDFARSWDTAENLLVDVAWAGLRQNETSLFGNGDGSEDYILPYLELIAETTPSPADLTEEGWAKFETGQDKGIFGTIPEAMSLLEYFMLRFAAPSPDAANRDHRRKLFQRQAALPHQEGFTWMFENYFRSDRHAVLLYRSFIHMRDTSWGDGPFLGATCLRSSKLGVQTRISLLKHLGHSGLDRSFVAPAWLFAWKYNLARGTDSGCSAGQAYVFYELLERLASYINFVVPRINTPKFRSEPRRNLAKGSVADYTSVVACVQRYFYRELQKRIWNDPVEIILDWLVLTDAEQKLFTTTLTELDAFSIPASDKPFQRKSAEPGTTIGLQESLYRRQIRYALVRAEFSHGDYEKHPEKLHLAISDKLPNALAIQGTGNFHVYRQLSIEHILPKSCSQTSDWMTACKWDKEKHYLWLDKLGNLSLLTVVDNRIAGSADWNDKKSVYQDIAQLRLTADIGKLIEFSPESCRTRHFELLSLLAKGWRLDKDCLCSAGLPNQRTKLRDGEHDCETRKRPRDAEHGCETRMPQRGDLVRTKDGDSFIDNSGWKAQAGEVLTVDLVDQDGDFCLMNKDGLRSNIHFRKYYVYVSCDRNERENAHQSHQSRKRAKSAEEYQGGPGCYVDANWDHESSHADSRSWQGTHTSEYQDDSNTAVAYNNCPPSMYKIRPCRRYMWEPRACPRGYDCTFAHGDHELRCMYFHCDYYCGFGTDCKLIHDIKRLDKFELVEVVKNLQRNRGTPEWLRFLKSRYKKRVDPNPNNHDSSLLKDYVEQQYHTTPQRT